MIAGVNHPECFEPNFNRTDTRVFVNEMFMLSWTTLSTVVSYISEYYKPVTKQLSSHYFSSHIKRATEAFIHLWDLSWKKIMKY